MCPDCGLSFFNLGSHRGKGLCRAVTLRRRLHAEGYLPVVALRSLLRLGVPPRFQRFIHVEAEETWLPIWVVSLINMGNWTDESIKRVEEDRDLQIAFALEYDIKDAS